MRLGGQYGAKDMACNRMSVQFILRCSAVAARYENRGGSGRQAGERPACVVQQDGKPAVKRFRYVGWLTGYKSAFNCLFIGRFSEPVPAPVGCACEQFNSRAGSLAAARGILPPLK